MCNCDHCFICIHFSYYFRFWASVEPYCADITNEEIRLLEELLKPPEDEGEYFKVSHLYLQMP